MASHRFEKGVQYWKRRTDLKHSPERLEQSAIEYFEWATENPITERKLATAGGEVQIVELPRARPFTLHAYCLFAGVSRRHFDNLAHKDEYKDVINWIKDVCYAQKFEGAAVGLFNANLISRDLGLADKQEVNTSSEQQPARLTLEDFYNIREEIEAGADKKDAIKTVIREKYRTP